MPNASELARTQHELLDEAVARVNNLKLSKESREFALREVRRLERELGVEALGNYNQPSAQEQQDEALVVSAPVLPTMTLTLHSLQRARNELKTLSYNETGAIIHALRVLTTKHSNMAGNDDAEKLLFRLLEGSVED